MHKYKLFEIMDEKTLDILNEKYPQDIFLIKNGIVAIEISTHNRWFDISKDNNLKLRQYLIPEKDIIEILKHSYDLNINTDNLRNSYAIDRIDSHNEYNQELPNNTIIKRINVDDIEDNDLIKHNNLTDICNNNLNIAIDSIDLTNRDGDDIRIEDLEDCIFSINNTINEAQTRELLEELIDEIYYLTQEQWMDIDVLEISAYDSRLDNFSIKFHRNGVIEIDSKETLNKVRKLLNLNEKLLNIKELDIIAKTK